MLICAALCPDLLLRFRPFLLGGCAYAKSDFVLVWLHFFIGWAS